MDKKLFRKCVYALHARRRLPLERGGESAMFLSCQRVIHFLGILGGAGQVQSFQELMLDGVDSCLPDERRVVSAQCPNTVHT